MSKLHILFKFILLAVVIASCASAEDELIVGTWRFADIQERISDDLKQQGRKPMAKADVDNMKKNAKYIFEKNREYTLDLISIKDNGEWWISENGVTLNMRSKAPNNAVGRATIQKLTANELVLVVQIVPQKHIQIFTLKKEN